MMNLVLYGGGGALVLVAGLILWGKFFGGSETIGWARLQTIGGICLVALGGLDWTSVIQVGVSWKQMLATGGAVFLNGLVTEILRRYRTTGGVFGNDLTPKV